MRLLADTSIWIDHLRRADAELAEALRRRVVVTHPMVIGEIAMGSIADRTAVLTAMLQLRQALPAEHAEVRDLVERHRLFGTGLGLIDAHLLASTLLTPDTFLWTRDKKLADAAAMLGVEAGKRIPS